MGEGTLKKRDAEKSTKSPKKTPLMVVPSHGKGLIRVGSLPGNTPGTGRPPSAIREQLRGSFSDRIAVLEGIADKEDSSASDRIRAVDVLAKYGLGEKTELTMVSPDVTARLQATVTLVSQKAPELLEELERIWK